MSIDNYLAKGYKLRKKVIAGKAYAYLQRGSLYKYIGPWAAKFEKYKRKPATHAKEDAKSKYKTIINEYKAYIERLEYEACLYHPKITQYVTEILPRYEPELWGKIFLLADGNVQQAILEAASLHRSYLDVVKDAIVREEKPPIFKKYIVETLKSYVNIAIEQKRGAFLPPGSVDNECPRCTKRLEYKKHNDSYVIVCPKRREEWFWNCPICGERMHLSLSDPFTNQVKLLYCPKCGYRLKFKTPVLSQVNEEYAIYAAYKRIDDPRLKGHSLVMVKADSKGNERIVHVIKSW